jgi:alpha,alpha-trehalose phosphorylase
MDATGDEEFMREAGLELLVETARLWRSLGHHDRQGHFRISGVTGPDEYSALGDNNIYTNLMAQQNLRAAADAAEHHQREAAAFEVTTEETAAWRDAANDMFIPYNKELGVHPQADGFTEHQVWDFEHTAPEQYPLMLHFPYFDLYRKQVVKQADLVLAMQLQGHAFTQEEKERNFAYYEALTVRDSSLSASTQGVIAAETGHLALAYEYLRETAFVDLYDLQENTRDGLHLAALAGVWTVLVAGFGGFRAGAGRIAFAPRLPGALTRLEFGLTYRGRRLHVLADQAEVTYSLRSGDPIELTHYGEPITIGAGAPATRAIPPAAPRPPVHQPAGREPGPHRQMG